MGNHYITSLARRKKAKGEGGKRKKGGLTRTRQKGGVKGLEKNFFFCCWPLRSGGVGGGGKEKRIRKKGRKFNLVSFLL